MVAAGLKPMATGSTARGGCSPHRTRRFGHLHFIDQVTRRSARGEPVRVMVSIDSNLDALEEFRYAEGDTWYKDMREPGFLASEVPESTPVCSGLLPKL